MNPCPRSRWFTVLFGMFLTLVSSPDFASAHCDGLDGPVVAAARQALDTGDVGRVLIWVQEADEPEIKLAFSRSMVVRRLGPEARQLADLHFFETLVRVHRAGEGAPYAGLQPAGRDLGPAIPSAERALDTADAGALSTLLNGATSAGLASRFREVLEAKRDAGKSVAAGRRYVSAYVQYIHFVEDLYKTATVVTQGHFEATPEARPHAH